LYDTTLGDMRSYNYVIVPIHDFDQVVYRIRPIDFDRYEGNFKIYAILQRELSYGKISQG
jgi:hypothetical protein